MLLVGLTGGIASGKSMVSGIFKSLGAYIIDADSIAHEVIKPGLSAWHEIVERFGRGILLEDGTINRPLLGSVIFRDSSKREILNSIMHPRIFEEVDLVMKEIEKEIPDAIVIFDAALLIETGMDDLVDIVILVYVSEDLQIKRLMERDGLSREEAIGRIRTQMPAEEKKMYADYIIDTSRSLEDIKRDTLNIFKKLKTMCNKKGLQFRQ